MSFNFDDIILLDDVYRSADTSAYASYYASGVFNYVEDNVNIPDLGAKSEVLPEDPGSDQEESDSELDRFSEQVLHPDAFSILDGIVEEKIEKKEAEIKDENEFSRSYSFNTVARNCSDEDDARRSRTEVKYENELSRSYSLIVQHIKQQTFQDCNAEEKKAKKEAEIKDENEHSIRSNSSSKSRKRKRVDISDDEIYFASPKAREVFEKSGKSNSELRKANPNPTGKQVGKHKRYKLSDLQCLNGSKKKNKKEVLCIKGIKCIPYDHTLPTAENKARLPKEFQVEPKKGTGSGPARWSPKLKDECMKAAWRIKDWPADERYSLIQKVVYSNGVFKKKSQVRDHMRKQRMDAISKNYLKHPYVRYYSPKWESKPRHAYKKGSVVSDGNGSIYRLNDEACKHKPLTSTGWEKVE